MPFINGRFYINPVIGHAVESARQAEIQRAASAHANQPAGGAENGGEATSENAEEDAVPQVHRASAVHRIEIEAAEVVPSHSGRASRGFVARIHRHLAVHPKSAPRETRSAREPRAALETHVFTNHRDLVQFLDDELTHDSHA